MPILLIVVAVVVLFLVVVAMQPADYRIERSITVAAPPGAAFAQVNDFHKWEAWSPWAKMDTSAKNAFEGAPAGAGAVFAWTGNNKVGQGRMTIKESRPGELIRIQLEFIKPFASIAEAQFSFKAAGNQTTVNWAMTGRKNFMSKAFCMFMNMDKMVGSQFEQGLADIKKITETTGKVETASR